MDEAADRNHGQARVLDLGQAVPVEGGLVLGKVKRIEGEVARGALALEGLEQSNNSEELYEGDPENDLLAAALKKGKRKKEKS